MFYITGDTHGDFSRVEQFCERTGTQKSDVLIILGDAGINYHGGPADDGKKEFLDRLPVTVFAIHGNHEMRPEALPSYRMATWNGGTVWYEPAHPGILFAKDGEVYDFAGKKTLAIGGAYSVDKFYRLQNGWKWFPDEQPSEETKLAVESRLEKEGWKVDAVLTHTCPESCFPIEALSPGVDQSSVDRSTEKWLDTLRDRLSYEKWYCGHFHTAMRLGRTEFMFENIDMFYAEKEKSVFLEDEQGIPGNRICHN